MMKYCTSLFLLLWSISILNELLPITSSPVNPVKFNIRKSNGGLNFFSNNGKKEHNIDSSQISNIVSQAVPLEKIKENGLKKDILFDKPYSSSSKTLGSQRSRFSPAIPLNVNDDWRSTNFFTSNHWKLGSSQTKPNHKNNNQLWKVKNARSIGRISEKVSKIPFPTLLVPQNIGKGKENTKFYDWNKYLISHFNRKSTRGKTDTIIQSQNVQGDINKNAKIKSSKTTKMHSSANEEPKIKPSWNLNLRETKPVKPVLLKNLETIISSKVRQKPIKVERRNSVNSLRYSDLREVKPVKPFIPGNVGKFNKSALQQKPVTLSKVKNSKSLSNSDLLAIKPKKPLIYEKVETFRPNIKLKSRIIVPPVEKSQSHNIKPEKHGVHKTISRIKTKLRLKPDTRKPISNKLRQSNQSNLKRKHNSHVIGTSVGEFRKLKLREVNLPVGTSRLRQLMPRTKNILSIDDLISFNSETNLIPTSQSKYRVNRHHKQKNINFQKSLKTFSQTQNTFEQKPLQNTVLNKKPKVVRVYLSQLSRRKTGRFPVNSVNMNSVSSPVDGDHVSKTKEDTSGKPTSKHINSFRNHPSQDVKPVKRLTSKEARKLIKPRSKSTDFMTHKTLRPKLKTKLRKFKQVKTIKHKNISKLKSSPNQNSNFRKIGRSLSPQSFQLGVKQTKPILHKSVQEFDKSKLREVNQILPMKTWKTTRNNMQAFRKSKNNFNSNGISDTNVNLDDILSFNFPGETILIPSNQARSSINMKRKHRHNKLNLGVNHISNVRTINIPFDDSLSDNTHFKTESRKTLKPTVKSGISSLNVQPNSLPMGSRSFFSNDNTISNTQPKRKYLSEILKSTQVHTETKWNSLQGESDVVGTSKQTLNTGSSISQDVFPSSDASGNTQTTAFDFPDFSNSASKNNFGNAVFDETIFYNSGSSNTQDNHIVDYQDSQSSLLPDEIYFDNTVSEVPTTQSPAPSNHVPDPDLQSIVNSNFPEDTHSGVSNFKASGPSRNKNIKISDLTGIDPNTITDFESSEPQSNAENTISDASGTTPEFINPFGLTIYDANMKRLSLEDMLKILQEESFDE